MKMPRRVNKGVQAAAPPAAKLQVAALPYRRRQDGSLEVLLVTTRGTGQWMVPKGWPIPGKTHSEAAVQEAYEEAGVRGTVDPLELGRFQHQKTRPPEPPLDCTIAVFPMAVEQELTTWPEREQRTRRWFSIGDAARAVESPDLAGLIAKIGEAQR